MPKPPKQSPKKRVKLEAFVIHGHVKDSPVNYDELFRVIHRMLPINRKYQIGDKVTALPVFVDEGEQYSFSAYVGSSDTSFLLLDLQDATEEERHLEPGKIVAKRTLGLIHPGKRIAIVQFVQQGVRAVQIAKLIETLARRANPEAFDDLSLAFVPVPAEEFLQALNEFSTIKTAKVRFARPNYDWEEYGETFQTLGKESGATSLEVSASAPRNGSLEKYTGLVGILKTALQKGRSMIKSASISGITENQTVVTTLNLDKHVESKLAEVPVTSTGQLAAADVQTLARTFLEETAPSEE